MPAILTSKVLAAVAGKIKDFDAARNTKAETRKRLPAGVRGKAQIVVVKAEQDDKGRPRIVFQGRVIEPEVYNGEEIYNAGVFCRVPMYETQFNGRTTTIQDRIAKLCTFIQMCGKDTGKADDVDDLNALCEAISKEKPGFLFSTWKNSDSEFINHGMDGAWVMTEADVKATEEVVEEEEGEDAPMSYGEAADNDDEKAISVLNDMCEAAGIDPNDWEKWTEVEAELLRLGQENPDLQLDTSEAQVEEPPKAKRTRKKKEPPKPKTITEAPQHGAMYGCDVEEDGTVHSVEITGIDEEAKTVSVSSYDNDYEYSDITWDRLVEDPRAAE